MKYIILTIVLGLTPIFAFNTLFICGENEPANKFSDSYSIRLNEEKPENIKVEAKLRMEDSLLYMSSYGPMPYRWPNYIHNLKITDKNGKLIQFEKRDSTAWVLKGVKKGSLLHLNYDLVIKHEEISWPGGIDGVAFKKEWGIMFSGRSLFIMNGGNKENIQLKFHVPQNWKLSVPWRAKNSSQNIYEASNLEQLQESISFAGTHEEMLIERDGFTLQFVLGGNSIIKQKGKYNQIATKVLDYYIKLMGGIPKSSPGIELSKVLVLINESEQIDGEVIGSHISMFLSPNSDSQSQMIGWFMFAHEFFHLWNGKTLRYSGTDADWFKEGVTNYYTIKALHQIKFANEEAIKMMLNNLFYKRYINDSGFGKIAPSAAASGFDKDNHWGLVYGGGLFAGMCIDLEIRNNTSNKKSLDDLMRHYYSKVGGTNKTISNTDLLNYAGEIGKTNFTSLAETCIFGLEHAPLDEFFEFAGIDVEIANKQLKLVHSKDKNQLQKNIWSGVLGEL